ncbi:uncharacterized protein [Euphorbia lathyris]|uniref:uncharacterized protein n=1 Tax=Euphorbia lathyris TaxID=212925 RepID=UPI0033142826
MSTMKFNRKPPLPKSPIKQRPRRVLQSSVQTPPGSLTKSQKPNSIRVSEDSELRPEYRTISWELRALARMVSGEIGDENVTGIGNGTGTTKSNPVFERGRFYEAYSARRNERLKRKKGGNDEEEVNTPYNLGVVVDSCKKRGDSKKVGSLRKSMISVERSENSTTVPRYALRSMSKENKKPPLGGGVIASEKKVGVRRGRKI